MFYRGGVSDYALSKFSKMLVCQTRFLLTRCRRARVMATRGSSKPKSESTERLYTIEPAFVFEEPHFTLGEIFSGQGTVRDAFLGTLSLLLTRLMITASFSRPCTPSTVPISRSGPYGDRRREVNNVTWA